MVTSKTITPIAFCDQTMKVLIIFSADKTNRAMQLLRGAKIHAHIDDATIDALTQYYRETLKPEHQVLDLMSSWISHLPQEESYKHITGLGMNQAELDGNPRLDERLVHNLNNEPTLPFHSESFDAVLIAVSVQYLIQPLASSRNRRYSKTASLSSPCHTDCFPQKRSTLFIR